MNALFSVKHDHCGLCGEQHPLFVLNLTRGEQPRLEPKQDGTHTGVCMTCWSEVADVLRPRLGIYKHQLPDGVTIEEHPGLGDIVHVKQLTEGEAKQLKERWLELHGQGAVKNL